MVSAGQSVNRVAATLIGVLLLALAFSGWRWSQASAGLVSAQRIIGTLSAGIASRDQTIVRLNQQYRAEQQQLSTLRLQQGRASAAALTREALLQRETDADPSLRDWSAAALPDAVIRLHARPAFASAADYLEWLSARDQLPDSGQPAANRGRSGRR